MEFSHSAILDVELERNEDFLGGLPKDHFCKYFVRSKSNEKFAEDLINIIPIKFGYNWYSSRGEELFVY